MDAVVLLKMLFLARVIDHLRQERTECISNGSEIKPFHFMASINAAYEPASSVAFRFWPMKGGLAVDLMPLNAGLAS